MVRKVDGENIPYAHLFARLGLGSMVDAKGDEECYVAIEMLGDDPQSFKRQRTTVVRYNPEHDGRSDQDKRKHRG